MIEMQLKLVPQLSINRLNSQGFLSAPKKGLLLLFPPCISVFPFCTEDCLSLPTAHSSVKNILPGKTGHRIVTSLSPALSLPLSSGHTHKWIQKAVDLALATGEVRRTETKLSLDDSRAIWQHFIPS